MRILITGGNGYVGRTLTRSLYGEHDVTVVDSLRYGVNRFDNDEMSRFNFRQVDIRDFDALSRAVEECKPELIIHLAAIHYIPECEAQPDEAITVNTLGTANVLRACPEGGAIVSISTAAVYAPEDTAHVEATSPIGPMDVYGLTKLHAEDYVRYWAKQKQLRAAIIRLFNVIGPGETNPHILPAILAQLLKGERTLHLGNCYPKRDYIDVNDVASGIASIAFGLADEPGVDVVNLGSGTSYSVYEVVDELSNLVEETLVIESDPARVRPSDRPVLMADNSHVRQKYGWQPTMTLSDSLKGLLANPDIPAELLARS